MTSWSRKSWETIFCFSTTRSIWAIWSRILAAASKLELLRLLFHSLSEPRHQILILSFEKHPHLMDHLPIADRVDLFRTRAKAPSHLEIDARPQPVGEFRVETGPDGKEPADQLQRFPQGSRGGVGAEVERTVFLNLSYDAQGREVFFDGEPQAGVPRHRPEASRCNGDGAP